MDPVLETNSATYFSDTMDPDDVIPMNDFWSDIDRAPNHIKRYLKSVYKNVQQFESFFENHSNVFFVENGMVTLYELELEDGRTNAVEYFKEILEDYEEAPNYMNFRGHIGQASENVIHFIGTFYPGKSFKDFLLSHPDVFVVFSDDTVSLIEDQSVNYFEDVLSEFGDGQHYLSLRGHIGQAKKHVQEYINAQHPGSEFMDFLLDNDDVFDVQGEDVFLK